MRVIRKITNSAGLIGATPISQIRCPFKISSFVIAMPRSHETKNASSGLAPTRAPLFQMMVRNRVIDCSTLLQVADVLGSNTTHCVPRRIDCSRKISRRRTLTYLHVGSLDIVRAPQTRIPRPSAGKARMQLTPRRFKLASIESVKSISNAFAPSRTSLAGDLCTPRSISIRA